MYAVLAKADDGSQFVVADDGRTGFTSKSRAHDVSLSVLDRTKSVSSVKVVHVLDLEDL